MAGFSYARCAGCALGRPPGKPSLRPLIWQLLLHCAYSRWCTSAARSRGLRNGRFPYRGYWPASRSIDEASWSEDKALLRTEQQRLVEAVARFDPARLDEQATQENTFVDLLWGIVMHDLYHVGEIQVLKRLYELQSEQS
jgi:hypothetical protein